MHWPCGLRRPARRAHSQLLITPTLDELGTHSLAPRVCAHPTQPGLPIHGVPSEFGALHVKLVIVMPTMLTADERSFVEAHFEPAAERAPGA